MAALGLVLLGDGLLGGAQAYGQAVYAEAALGHSAVEMDVLGAAGWGGVFSKQDDLVLVVRYLGTAPYEGDTAGLAGLSPRYGIRNSRGLSLGVSGLLIYGQLRNEAGLVPRAGFYAAYGGTKGLFVFTQTVLGEEDFLSAFYIGYTKPLRRIYGIFVASETAALVSSQPSVKRSWLVEERFHLGPSFSLRRLQLFTGLSLTIRLTHGEDFSNFGLFFRVAYP